MGFVNSYLGQWIKYQIWYDLEIQTLVCDSQSQNKNSMPIKQQKGFIHIIFTELWPINFFIAINIKKGLKYQFYK